jgi:hypothetical protein
MTPMIIPMSEMVKEKKLRKNVDSNTSITIKNGNTTPINTHRKPVNINRFGVIYFIRTTSNAQSDL